MLAASYRSLESAPTAKNQQNLVMPPCQPLFIIIIVLVMPYALLIEAARPSKFYANSVTKIKSLLLAW